MTSFNVRMAKATEADIAATFAVANLAEELRKGYYPFDEESEVDDGSVPTFFDPDDHDHLRALYDRLLKITESASVFRVAAGLDTLLWPQNAIVDPNDVCIGLHPRFGALVDAAKAYQAVAVWDEDTDRPAFDAAEQALTTALAAFTPATAKEPT